MNHAYSSILNYLGRIKYAGLSINTWFFNVSLSIHFQSRLKNVLCLEMQVRKWISLHLMYTNFCPTTWADISVTMARSPPHPASRASCGHYFLRGFKSLTHRYKKMKHKKKKSHCSILMWFSSLLLHQLMKLETVLYSSKAKAAEPSALRDNYRITQPLNNRTVLSSFIPGRREWENWGRGLHISKLFVYVMAD